MTNEGIQCLAKGVDPSAPFALGEDGETTHGQLWHRAHALADRLTEQPPGPVLISCEDALHFATALLGTWIAHRIAMLPASLRPGTLAELDRAAVHLHDRDGGSGSDVRSIPDGEAATPGMDVAAQSILVVVHTSGTTGAQQPFPKTAAQVLGEAYLLARTFELGAGDRVLATVPPHHIYGLLFGVLAPLVSGAALVRKAALHASAVAAGLRQHRATVLVSTPAHLRALEVLDPSELPTIARVFSSGATLPSAAAHRLHARFGLHVTEVFGSTETGGVAFRTVPGPQAEPPPWTAFPGVTVDAGPDGELRVDSPLLPKGTPRPMPCPDRIRLVEGGFLHEGRTDDVVKVAGKRLSLRALEARLLEIPGVQDAAVVADDDDVRGVRITAAVVAPALDADTIRRRLSGWFDPILVPRRIRVLAVLPREPSGKLSRAALLAALESPTDMTAPPRLRLGPVATEGADVLRDVHVPVDSSLFDGHFPGHPVLPGVAELSEIVLPTIAEAWPELGPVRRVSRLKFKRPIVPGDDLRLQLGRTDDATRVTFRLERNGEVCASGNVFHGEAHPK